MGDANHRGEDLDEACATCKHPRREHADGPCLWPVGAELKDCGCCDFQQEEAE